VSKKIFVSYKFHDSDVAPIISGYRESRTRDYVDALEGHLLGDHMYKGESADEPLDHLAPATIQQKLYTRIYDSTATLLLVSPNMREAYTPESKQWIAQEIAYSLCEHSRGGTTSHTNAMLAVVLPDSSGSYGYHMQARQCCATGCTCFPMDRIFPIHKANMFNRDAGEACTAGLTIYHGEHSFIPSVAWEDFIGNVNVCLSRAYSILDDIASYTIAKTLN